MDYRKNINMNIAFWSNQFGVASEGQYDDYLAFWHKV